MRTILFISALAFFFTAQLALAEEKNSGAVVAIYAEDGGAIRANELVTTKKTAKAFVDNQNLRVELAPFSVAQFNEQGELQLLRGSAYFETRKERTITTASSKVDFIGEMLLSYDYKEKSSSAFVIMGQARMQNPHQPQQSSILDKNQGATMVVGDVFPSAVRSLDHKSTSQWLAGYGWSEQYRVRFLKGFPQPGNMKRGPALEEAVPEKLAAREGDPVKSLETTLIPEDTRLQDYFSSLDSADDTKPRYYEDKLSMDVQVGSTLGEKKKQGVVMDPEDAALIPLPSVHIDTELPRLTIVSAEEQKRFEEISSAPIVSKKASRKLASIPVVKTKAVKPGEQNDPEISAALERLRKLRETGSFDDSSNNNKTRSPASVSSPIPDPVYDFAENF